MFDSARDGGERAALAMEGLWDGREGLWDDRTSQAVFEELMVKVAEQERRRRRRRRLARVLGLTGAMALWASACKLFLD